MRRKVISPHRIEGDGEDVEIPDISDSISSIDDESPRRGCGDLFRLMDNKNKEDTDEEPAPQVPINFSSPAATTSISNTTVSPRMKSKITPSVSASTSFDERYKYKISIYSKVSVAS